MSGMGEGEEGDEGEGKGKSGGQKEKEAAGGGEKGEGEKKGGRLRVLWETKEGKKFIENPRTILRFFSQ